jgi:hypothetical protein
MNNNLEVWKDIPGYKDLYQASNFGNIKSLGNNAKRKDKILKPAINSSNQTVLVLAKNKTKTSYIVHSLIAKTFLNLDINSIIRVKHIDGNKLNNHFTNLKVDNKGLSIIKNFNTEPFKHYNHEKASLYKFAEDHELNAWEFDIIKRIISSRKKGTFKEDLKETKEIIDIYLNEFK